VASEEEMSPAREEPREVATEFVAVLEHEVA